MTVAPSPLEKAQAYLAQHDGLTELIAAEVLRALCRKKGSIDADDVRGGGALRFLTIAIRINPRNGLPASTKIDQTTDDEAPGRTFEAGAPTASGRRDSSGVIRSA